MYGGTPTFWQRGLWDFCFQNPSESSAYLITLVLQMGVRHTGAKRLPRHLRNEDLPTDTFTPRTYQVSIYICIKGKHLYLY